MKLPRAAMESLPQIGLLTVAAAVIAWTALTIRSIVSLPTGQPVATSPVATPTTSPPLTPKWLKTAPPTVLPSLPPTTLAPTTLPQNTAAPIPPSTLPTTLPKPPTVTPQALAPQQGTALPQMRYGHLPYAEASPDQLASVGTYGQGAYRREEQMDKTAAAAFTQMVAAAQADGVYLAPISGFRTIADQEKLFERQIGRQGSPEAAARLSAPAGYSEHHTGYAIDIGDGSRPGADLKFEFEDTPAYRWLAANAQRYGFELSFPRGNAQGVSFEPWHWRYIGTARATAIFSVARTLRSP